MRALITDILILLTTYMSTWKLIVGGNRGNPAQYGIRFWVDNKPPRIYQPKEVRLPILYDKPQPLPGYRTGPVKFQPIQKIQENQPKNNFFADALPDLIADLLSKPVYQKPRLISRTKVQRKKLSPFMLPMMYERGNYLRGKRSTIQKGKGKTEIIGAQLLGRNLYSRAYLNSLYQKILNSHEGRSENEIQVKELHPTEQIDV